MVGPHYQVILLISDSRTVERSSSSQDWRVMFNDSSLQGQAIWLYFQNGHVMGVHYLFDWLDGQRDDRIRNVNGFLATKNERSHDCSRLFYQRVSRDCVLSKSELRLCSIKE